MASGVIPSLSERVSATVHHMLIYKMDSSHDVMYVIAFYIFNFLT